MSYADAAAPHRGQRQSAEECTPKLTSQLQPPCKHPAQPILTPSSPSSAPHPVEIQNTDAPETESLIDVDSDHISTVPSDFTSQSIQTSTQSTRESQQDAADEAREQAHAAKERANRKTQQAEKKGKQFLGVARENSNNPVVLGNVVVWGVMATVFGGGVYRQWQREGFSWGFAGVTAGVLGVFGAADYFVSRWLFQKYPPKE